MKTSSVFRAAAGVFFAAAMATALSGCASGVSGAHNSTYQTLDPLSKLQAPCGGDHSFFVESAEGAVKFPESGTGGSMADISLSAGDINKVLSGRFPKVFGKKPGAIPLHIAYSGMVYPMNLGEGAAPNAPIADGRATSGGKITVSVFCANENDRTVVHIPYRRVGSPGPTTLCMWCCLPAAAGLYVQASIADAERETHPDGWREIKRSPNEKGLAFAKGVLSELVAAGVVKSLDRMTPEQMAKLAGRSHRTAEQRRAAAFLSESAATTFSVSDDGRLFAEAEHAFTPVPFDFSALSTPPEIVMQTFDAETRNGRIDADITGCDENLAIDYLPGRLVPEICRTFSIR